MKRNAVFAGIIAVLAIVGVIFLVVAAYIALAERYGEMHASLILAGSAFGLAIITYIIMKIVERAARNRQSERAKVDASALLTVAALAAAPVVLRSRALMMLAVPLVAFGGLSLLTKPKKKKRRRPEDTSSTGQDI
ncbi:chromate transport protein ChrA [Phyllobacterium trifolii]|uniref:Chromate transport protein ChrA n=1 Tax=Phyllobacterium trifolii TaxID=300193 RepID=A0A839UAR4_9HYPH|nr:YwiC-like family protein [Phyllobacterium trifolii]MBB3145771.1 chromate transport protein ChrA [Phyllobacterium trifolii]